MNRNPHFPGETDAVPLYHHIDIKVVDAEKEVADEPPDDIGPVAQSIGPVAYRPQQIQDLPGNTVMQQEPETQAYYAREDAMELKMPSAEQARWD